MQLHIPKDIFDNPRPPRLFLCDTGKKRIGELNAYDINGDFKWNQYSEISFTINRYYTDVINGETYLNPLFDKAEGLRKVEVEGYGYFTIQDPNTSYSDKDIKEITAFSSEYETGTKYLENFYVNTGEVNSIEVTYEQLKYGADATKDVMYSLAKENAYSATEKYFHRVYSDSDSYEYEQIQISNESDYLSHFKERTTSTRPQWIEDVLYVHNYANVQFYDVCTPELSLLHCIFKKIPEWKIGHVDYSLWHKERKISEDRISVYDILMNDVADVFDCVVEWDILSYEVNFYETTEDGITNNDTVDTKWETDVYVSRENLANEISIKYSTDDIKTKLKITGESDLDIREVNLGKEYIMNLDYYHNLDWMEQDLFEAYDDYLNAVDEYRQPYTEAKQNWVNAQKKRNELMNAIPATGNVVLVGDKFDKLYCLYPRYIGTTTYDESGKTTYYASEYGDKLSKQPTKTDFVNGKIYYVDNQKSQLQALIKKLNLYQVNNDIDGTNKDNILLELRNSNKDAVTIRIYDSYKLSSGYDANAQYYICEDGNPNDIHYMKCYFDSKAEYDSCVSDLGNLFYVDDYKISFIQINGGDSAVKSELSANERSLEDWANGNITAESWNLHDYTIKSIGTMGAYFCLNRDETQEVNIEDYGINMLLAKQDIYITILQAQIEAMYSQEKYQCIASDIQPTVGLSNGLHWLDTSSNVPIIKVYKSGGWTQLGLTQVFNVDNCAIKGTSDDALNYELFSRYKDNYDKLVAIQNVLKEKEKKAQFCEMGYAVDAVINVDKYTNNPSTTLQADMKRAAEKYFVGHVVTSIECDKNFPLYIFTCSYDKSEVFALYLNGTTPYVSYDNSMGTNDAKMRYYSSMTEFEKFFNEEQWNRMSPFIREDEYNNSNFLLNSYETEEERMQICEELVADGTKELKKLSRPSLEFSMDMANILALPEFSSLFSQFRLGNFIRIELFENHIEKARLLEVNINFSDLSDFSCSFGNLVQHLSEIDKHADLMKQAVTAGKQVASSAGDWQMAVEKTNKIETEIANGLMNATLQIGKSYGQNISWGSQGILCRKLIDGTTDQYEDEQIRIINNKLMYSNDGFQTSKSAFGTFEYDGQKYSGILAEAVIGGLVRGAKIIGSEIYAGDLEGDFITKVDNSDVIFNVNNNFIVTKDGAVTMKAVSNSDDNKFVTTATYQQDMNQVNSSLAYYTEVHCEGSTIFNNTNSTLKLTCLIYSYGNLIDAPTNTKFSWIRNSSDTSGDYTWNSNHANLLTNNITIGNADVVENANFSCIVTITT